ncbi:MULTISPECIES: coiled coil domain-containing protein [unclassified Nitrospina]|uniref:coiled coil domain-containing protein n=1 Tax=unclassified Nitrospina TaxID=2638683 RepID=UPI003F96A1E2
MGKKEEYINWMQSKLDEVSADIDKLKAKANQAEAKAQVKYLDEVEAMRKKKADVQAKLTDVQTAGEGAWEDLKTGLDKSWDDLKSGVESAWSRFKG